MSHGHEAETGARSSGTLVWAIRTACIAGFVGLAAAQYLARSHIGLSEAMRVAQAVADPETTGSITQNARTARIDPCTAASASRTARP